MPGPFFLCGGRNRVSGGGRLFGIGYRGRVSGLGRVYRGGVGCPGGRVSGDGVGYPGGRVCTPQCPAPGTTKASGTHPARMLSCCDLRVENYKL